MFARWLARLEAVHEASCPEEREAVYRFRYTVYVEELGRKLAAGADPDRRVICDEDDERDYTLHLYTGRPGEVSGSLRLCHWEPGQVPEHHAAPLSMHVFPGIRQTGVGEIGRLMIHPTMRGRLVLLSLIRAMYDAAAQRGCELLFCNCAPGLVPHYRRLGMRPYRAPLVPTEDGLEVPLVGVMSDAAYLQRMGSALAPLARKHFGPGKRRPTDLEPLRPLLEDGQASIEMDSGRVWEQIQQELLGEPEPSFLDNLSQRTAQKLTRQGFVVDVPPGTLITEQGLGQREMYVILSGTVEILGNDGRRINVLGKGDLFGEVAFFTEEGRRSASVRSASEVRLLVIRRRFLEELRRTDPDGACQILFNLGRVLSGRLARLTRLMQDTAPD